MSDIPYPYDALAEYGIHPASPQSTLEPKNYRGPFAEAWRFLRKPAQRLITDFFLYRAADETRIVQFLNEIRVDPSRLSPMDIRRLLAEDAPILLVLLDNRTAARAFWEADQKHDPANASLSHCLALLAYAETCQPETAQAEEHTTDAWQRAIADWCRTLADEKYWKDWCFSRNRVYYGGYSNDRLAAASEETYEHLRKRLLNELAERADHHAQNGNADLAQHYEELETLYLIEWQASLALKETGGLPMPRGRPLVCGPLLLKRLGLHDELSHSIQRLQAEVDRYAALSYAIALTEGAEPSVSREQVRNLRLYFSELAPAAALLAHDRPHAASEKLPPLGAAPDPNYPAYCRLSNATTVFARDSAQLALDIYLALATLSISSWPPELERAGVLWKTALARCRAAGMAEVAVREIEAIVLGRAESLEEERGRSKDEIGNMCVALLDTAYQLMQTEALGGADDLRRALALALSRRATRYHLQDDYVPARRDIERVFRLAPEDPDYRDQLCNILLDGAGQFAENGQGDDARRDVRRAIQLAEMGLVEYPENADLRQTLSRAGIELDVLEGNDPRDRVWQEVDRQRAEGSGDHAPIGHVVETARLLVAAEECFAEQDFPAAEALLKQVLQRDAHHVHGRLLTARLYGQWAKVLYDEAAETEQPDAAMREAEEKVKLGLQYDSSNDVLVRLAEAIARFRDLMGR